MSEPSDVTTQSAIDPNSASSEGTAGNSGRIVWRRLLQRKLLIRVTLPTAIGLIQLVFAIIAIITDHVSPLVLLWLVPSIAVGYFFGQKTEIGWDDESAQVSLVKAQVLLVVSYIVVRVGTHYVLETVLSGRMWLAVALLLVSFGLFFGRSLGLARQIWKALKQEEVNEKV